MATWRVFRALVASGILAAAGAEPSNTGFDSFVFGSDPNFYISDSVANDTTTTTVAPTPPPPTTSLPPQTTSLRTPTTSLAPPLTTTSRNTTTSTTSTLPNTTTATPMITTTTTAPCSCSSSAMGDCNALMDLYASFNDKTKGKFNTSTDKYSAWCTSQSTEPCGNANQLPWRGVSCDSPTTTTTTTTTTTSPTTTSTTRTSTSTTSTAANATTSADTTTPKTTAAAKTTTAATTTAAATTTDAATTTAAATTPTTSAAATTTSSRTTVATVTATATPTTVAKITTSSRTPTAPTTTTAARTPAPLAARFIWEAQQRRVLQLDFKGIGACCNFPNSISGLSALQVLDIKDNDFGGTIQSELGKLLEMTRLDLAHNAFTGAVPKSFALLTKLTVLDLEGNGLTVFPESLCSLTDQVRDCDLGQQGNISQPECISEEGNICNPWMEPNGLPNCVKQACLPPLVPTPAPAPAPVPTPGRKFPWLWVAICAVVVLLLILAGCLYCRTKRLRAEVADPYSNYNSNGGTLTQSQRSQRPSDGRPSASPPIGAQLQGVGETSLQPGAGRCVDSKKPLLEDAYGSRALLAPTRGDSHEKEPGAEPTTTPAPTSAADTLPAYAPERTMQAQQTEQTVQVAHASAVRTAFEGRWTDEPLLGDVKPRNVRHRTIVGTELHWADGSISQLTLLTPTAFETEMQGERHRAELVASSATGQLILWDDGDRWVRFHDDDRLPGASR